jgi:hypothetical protein
MGPGAFGRCNAIPGAGRPGGTNLVWAQMRWTEMITHSTG